MPEQLLLRFNTFSEENWGGSRDKLVEFILQTFLDSPRKPPRRATPSTGTPGANAETTRHVTAAADEARDTFEILQFARQHAQAIVDVTSPEKRSA